MGGIRDEIQKLRSEIGYKRMASAPVEVKSKYDAQVVTRTRTYDEYMEDLEKKKKTANGTKSPP